MARSGNHHYHFGTFLLFSSFVLLLISTLSSNYYAIALLKVHSREGASIGAGTFGTCTKQASNTICAQRHLGYPVTSQLASYTSNSLDNATKALILHPIATVFLFLGFLIAIGSDRIGYLFAAFVAFIGFLLALTALAVDLAIFIPIKHHLNSNSSTTNSTAAFGAGFWITLAGTLVAFVATIATCLACVTARKHRNLGRGEGGGEPILRREVVMNDELEGQGERGEGLHSKREVVGNDKY